MTTVTQIQGFDLTSSPKQIKNKRGITMKRAILTLFVGITCVLAKDATYKIKSDIYLKDLNDRLVKKSSSLDYRSRTEQITLWEDDFEGGQPAWSSPTGNWAPTDTDYYSETTSWLSADDNNSGEYRSNDLFSPTIPLPNLGEGEIMHFAFWLRNDMPDFQQEDDPATAEDESGFLADYYAISLLDPSKISWHATTTGSPDGSNIYWVGDEDTGGYLDSWVQYLDTPSITVPSGGILSADMKWAIESPDGAVGAIPNTCVDGWDQANVQISVNGGDFMIIEGSVPYDFQCGYGMVYNGFDGGPGWGGTADWQNVTFDLSAYEGSDVVVRFGFYSDPAYSTADDPSITGLYVDNIMLGDFMDDADGEEQMTASGEVWVDMFYDYGDATQPGALEWNEYLPGMPFNGNAFLDISEFAGKDVIFRIQTRYDGDHNSDISSGQGAGLFIDDFRIYKESGGSYPAPGDLSGVAGDSSAELAWGDMNASGSGYIIYDNNNFGNVISMTNEDAEGWAGSSFEFGGASTVNAVSIYHDAANNAIPYDMSICLFGTLGSLYSSDAVGCVAVNTESWTDGWNEVAVEGWDMDGSYIIGHTFSNLYGASLDESVSFTDNHSYFNFTGSSGLGAWDPQLSSDGSFEGEWGIRADISYESAGVTYNVYQDGVGVASGLQVSDFTATGLENNTTYTFAVSATYPDGEESGTSNEVQVTPQPQTVYEVANDDGTFESEFQIGSGDFALTQMTVEGSDDVLRFKWYQSVDAGAFYVKIFDDNNGAPGEEVYSKVVAGGLVAGWNEKDLSDDGETVSGTFWVGMKAFSSTPPIGLDDSGSGSSVSGDGSSWEAVNGNLAIRLILDEGNGGGGGDCSVGDVNADGSINVLDIVTIVNFIMGVDSPSDEESCSSDANADGSINVLDIVSIVNIIMGG